MDAIAGTGSYPFAIAALVLVGLVVVELVAMLVGMSVSSLVDHGMPGHAVEGHAEHGVLGAWMSWLNAGGVPLLVLIMIWLACFAIAGFAIQGVAQSIAGTLPTIIAGVGALVIAAPATRTLSRWTARIIPREETSIVSQADFIGLTGTVTLGPLDQGKPGRVRVRDRHGNIHVLQTKGAGDHVITQGSAVLIVDRANGVFQAIPAPAELGADHSSGRGAAGP